VPAQAGTDRVQPGQGGLSVSPDDPLNLPRFRRPPAFQGTGRDPVWCLDSDGLGSELVYRPDPTNPAHGFIEPARPMTLDEFQIAVAGTASLWRLVVPDVG